MVRKRFKTCSLHIVPNLHSTDSNAMTMPWHRAQFDALLARRERWPHADAPSRGPQGIGKLAFAAALARERSVRSAPPPPERVAGRARACTVARAGQPPGPAAASNRKNRRNR